MMLVSFRGTMGGGMTVAAVGMAYEMAKKTGKSVHIMSYDFEWDKFMMVDALEIVKEMEDASNIRGGSGVREECIGGGPCL